MPTTSSGPPKEKEQKAPEPVYMDDEDDDDVRSTLGELFYFANINCFEKHNRYEPFDNLILDPDHRRSEREDGARTAAAGSCPH